MTIEYKNEKGNILKIETNITKIDLFELGNDIKFLKEKVYKMLEYPKGNYEELKSIIDNHNEMIIAEQLQDEVLLKGKEKLMVKCQEIK